MKSTPMEFVVERLGQARIRSPMREVEFVDDAERVLYHSSLSEVEACLRNGRTPPSFEMGGPREKIYFDSSKLRCGIVTCGGLCPGLNDVIRALVFGLYYHYGVLFAIGGDGTMRASRGIAAEIGRRRLKIGVVGIPKTIDNDISAIDKTFGFETAVSAATRVIASAHTEAEGARNGIGLVKVMGRESGFIAALASLSNADVNFCLVPEVAFTSEGFLKALHKRLERRLHAVVVTGEGAGQELAGPLQGKDASGNIRLADIGLFLKDRIADYFQTVGMDIIIRYIDPSYIIRFQYSGFGDEKIRKSKFEIRKLLREIPWIGFIETGWMLERNWQPGWVITKAGMIWSSWRCPGEAFRWHFRLPKHSMHRWTCSWCESWGHPDRKSWQWGSSPEAGFES